MLRLDGVFSCKVAVNVNISSWATLADISLTVKSCKQIVLDRKIFLIIAIGVSF